MLLHEVAETSADVTATSGRRAKVERVARCLSVAADSGDPALVRVVVSYLMGELPQRRTGLGYAALRDAPRGGATSGGRLTVQEVDAAFSAAQDATGPGSQTARRTLLHDLLARADESERRLIGGLVSGELRQGAQQGVLLDAVATASGAAPALVRRSVTLAGSVADVAVAALVEGPQALGRFGLRVGQPLTPMLAASATDLATALQQTAPAAVEWKLDGIRIQIHRDGDDVAVFTRTLDDITARVPDVVAVARSLPVTSVVLDGEAIALRPDGRPRPFQQTAARVATRVAAKAEQAAREVPLTTFLFDVLHLDGTDLTGEPLRRRRQHLDALGRPDLVVPHLVVRAADPGAVPAAEDFAREAVQRGHEGVVVKSLEAAYEMGRRGSGWVKVKPVHTLDLVVLAVEWGHGRRTGRLSNLHLGALDPHGRFGPAGGTVMLGKTFKGMTDEMLAWQTERFRDLQVSDDGWVVTVRPEQVVEIAVDGVQSSPRYPAGLALRFARVVRYRPDKSVAQADPIEAVEQLHQP